MSLRLAAPVSARRGLRQTIVGLFALPLSVLPFVAYGTLTPEGRLVRDRAVVRISPPSLPKLSADQKAAARARAPRFSGGAVALAYHGIGSASADGEGQFVISPRRFAEHLAMLRAAGVNTVTAGDVARSFTGGPPLPANAVMISFDDGRTDAMLYADPLLKQARMAATMFVITAAASDPSVYYAGWDSLEAYARSGRWDLQSHTSELHREQKAAGGKQLPALTSLKPGESLPEFRARVSADLDAASSAIESHTGRAPVAFAYPFGAYGAERTNDPAIGQILREEVGRRYRVAFEQDDQESIPLLTPQQDPLLLRRLEVGRWSGAQLLERIARVSGSGPVATPGPDDDIEIRPDDPALAGLDPTDLADDVPTGGRPIIPGVSDSKPVPVAGLRIASATPRGPAFDPTTGAPVPTSPPSGGATPPATTPPTNTTPPNPTSPPTTPPPSATVPPTTPPPSATVPPGCSASYRGKGPKKCNGGAG